MSRSSSTKVVNPRTTEILNHRANTLYSVNQQLETEKEAARTLRNGQLLWPVRVQEDLLNVIDGWITYADDSLEEANAGPGKKVVWAEEAEVLTFERYAKELEEDSDEEFYYGYDYDDESVHQEFQSKLAAFPEPPLSAVREEMIDEDFRPFPPRLTPNTLSEIMEECYEHEQPLTYEVFLRNLHDTLEEMGYNRREYEYQAILEAGQITISDRATRTNRFHRA